MTPVQCNGIFHWWRDSGPETSGFSNILALRTQDKFYFTYKGIGQQLSAFCVYVSVVVRRFATGDVFVYLL